MDNKAKIFRGNGGECWVDDEKLGEVYALSAEVTVSRKSIQRCGMMMEDSVVTGLQGKGSVKLFHCSSYHLRLLGDALKGGKDVRTVIVSKLTDPDISGAERVALKGVSFDKIALANWEAGAEGRIELPFVFTDYEFLDLA